MDNQKNSVVEKIAETISYAIGDETVALPLAFCGGESSRSDEINAKYVLEIEEYQNAPTPACNKSDALKLLKKFASVAVDPSELHAENMSNMIHAGSIVTQGSGRAIVVATGEICIFQVGRDMYGGVVFRGLGEISGLNPPL